MYIREEESKKHYSTTLRHSLTQVSRQLAACLLYNVNLKGNMIRAHKHQIMNVGCINRLHICRLCTIYGFSTEYIYHASTLVYISPHPLSQYDQIANEMTDGERTNPVLDSSSKFLLD